MPKIKELPAGVPEVQGPEGPGPDANNLPKYGTPVVLDPTGPVPREVKQLHRVPAGASYKRFKVRADNHGSQYLNPRYIVAENEQQAKEEFSRCSGLAAYLKGFESDGIEVPKPRYIVTVLPD